MSKVMLLLGTVFLLLGALLGGFILSQPGQAQIMALTPDVSALLLVGGGLCLGLGAVVDALRRGSASIIATSLQPSVSHSHTSHRRSSPEQPATTHRANADHQNYSAKTERQVVPSATAEKLGTVASKTMTRAAVSLPETSPETSVAETISALEQAQNDIAQALGIDPPQPKPDGVAAAMEVGNTLTVESDEAGNVTEKFKQTVKETDEFGTASEETVVTEAEYEAVTEEIELFVVEEKVIRGRPARVLSDGTVEAETDEGWMRFENLEHLDEYLEAMVPEA